MPRRSIERGTAAGDSCRNGEGRGRPVSRLEGYAKLIEDQRAEFIPEPAGIDDTMLALVKYPVPTGKLVADAYLAAFAIASARVLITLDRGFRQFKGLDVEILFDSWAEPVRPGL